MAIITLTSDLGLTDHYVASVKAAILNQAPQSHIVDVSHLVPAFDIHEAVFLVRSVWPQFPMGTVHVIGVQPELSADTPHIVVQHMSHYFVGADNGMFGLLFDDDPEDIFEITLPQGEDWNFPMRGVFATAAAHLSKGGAPEFLGRRMERFHRTIPALPIIDEDAIRAHVVHIDHYGNIYTNLTRDLFEAEQRGRRYNIQLKTRAGMIPRISQTFSDVGEGDAVAFWAQNDHLLIAINGGSRGGYGSAQQLLGLHRNDIVRIQWYGDPTGENDFPQ